MARRPVVLVTGAGGEIGHGLIPSSPSAGRSTSWPSTCGHSLPRWPGAAPVAGSATSSIATCSIASAAEFEIAVVFHLAALLSTRAEFVPETAHEVNVQGTLNLLQLAVDEAR